MDRGIYAFTTIATAIVGLAVIAVLVSGNAKTSSVINSGGNAFVSAIGVAISPVTGQTQQIFGEPG